MRPDMDADSKKTCDGGRDSALKEVLLLWTLAFLVIVVFRLVPPLSTYAKAAAAVAFLYLPGAFVWRRREDYRDYGAVFANWKSDVALGLKACALALPAFSLVFAAFVLVALPLLPDGIGTLVTPYASATTKVAFRLPGRFGEHVLDQFLAVALPEEFFYRGFIQKRLRAVWPSGKQVLGVSMGPAFWCTAALFALGHLAILQPWRLMVFFPALAFGWLREKSGSILPGIIFHAMCNLTLFVLEASFFGARL